MSENLNTLIKLQEIDSQIISLKHKCEFIPQQIKKLDHLSEEIDTKFETEKKKLADLEKKKKEKERQIEDIQEKIKKLKEKTPQIKTNKEYQALLKEIELIEQDLKKEEENLLSILYSIDEAKESLNEVKKEIDERKKEIENKKMQLEKEIDSINKKIETLKESRKQLITKLPEDLYDEYIELMKKHKGLAVAEVINSVCQGCFLHIPPQLYVEIKLNQSIYHCPQCGRILFYKAKEQKEQTQQVKAE